MAGKSHLHNKLKFHSFVNERYPGKGAYDFTYYGDIERTNQ